MYIIYTVEYLFDILKNNIQTILGGETALLVYFLTRAIIIHFLLSFYFTILLWFSYLHENELREVFISNHSYQILSDWYYKV